MPGARRSRQQGLCPQPDRHPRRPAQTAPGVRCDPRLVKANAARKVKERAKLDLLMAMLPELVDEGRRVLLFSQFTSMLALIEPELDNADIGYVTLTGDTVDRETPVRRFQDGEVPIFLISLKYAQPAPGCSTRSCASCARHPKPRPAARAEVAAALSTHRAGLRADPTPRRRAAQGRWRPSPRSALPRAVGAQGFPSPPCPLRRRLRARWAGRHHRAPAGPGARPGLAAAGGGGEPARRGRQHRRPAGRAGAARRARPCW